MSTSASVTRAPLDRTALIQWFLDTRARSRSLFDLLHPDAFYEQPIPLRHPIIFYEGHLSAFAMNTVGRRALRHPGIDDTFDALFERGIDPEDASAAHGHARNSWPSRDAVRRYVETCDDTILELLHTADLDRPGDPYLDHAEAVFTIIEHELTHQETMLYLWHRLPYALKIPPPDARANTERSRPASGPATVGIPRGVATLGANRGDLAFGWDNEFPSQIVNVPAFEIDTHQVTNVDYLGFVDAGGYENPDFWSPDGWDWRIGADVRHPAFWERRDGTWHWRGMFELVPLPATWPVWVTHAEASAYARWAGHRLPTEAEYHRAAYGTPEGPERSHPWGDAPPDETRGNFGFRCWDPVPVGSYPAGASAWGIHDLVGNGWEWTSTPFHGFPGFTPLPSYPQYSADFFDDRHFVIKGASPATATELVRRSFRNWFRPTYPYVFSGFRCVRA